MSKIPFSTISVSTEVFPDFVTPVTIDGSGLTTTLDDISGNIISVNYEEFAETLTELISSGTLANTLATKQYVDNVSSYTNAISEKLNTVSGDVATLITFRNWPDD